LRRIPITMVTPDMILARDIWGRNGLLLAKGIDNLVSYREKLINNGIATLYIEDELSDDIEGTDEFCDKVRTKCSDVLSETISKANKSGAVDMKNVDTIVSSIMKELFANSEMLLNLSDISMSSSVTLQHSIDATIYALFICKLCNMNDRQMQIVGKGTLLHDIGKIALDQDVLYKNGYLSDEERKHVEKHAQWGFRILEENDGVESSAKEIALLHHERLDGTGYPYKLKGKDIPLFPRLVAVADVYDALTSERCYKPAMSNEKAIDILCEDAKNSKLDCELVDVFTSKLAVYPNGIVVLLNNGEPAIVKQQNKGDTRRPVVRIIDFKNKSAYAKRDCDLTYERDLSIVKSNIKISDLPDTMKRQFA